MAKNSQKIFGSSDGRCMEKVSLLFSSGSNFMEPYQIPEKKWVDDPTKLPKVDFPQVYTYLNQFSWPFH